jgi:hypothetical protein
MGLWVLYQRGGRQPGRPEAPGHLADELAGLRVPAHPLSARQAVAVASCLATLITAAIGRELSSRGNSTEWLGRDPVPAISLPNMPFRSRPDSPAVARRRSSVTARRVPGAGSLSGGAGCEGCTANVRVRSLVGGPDPVQCLGHGEYCRARPRKRPSPRASGRVSDAG